MAAIALPPGFFGNRPPVFGPLVQSFERAFGDVHSNVALTQDAWQFTTGPDVVGSLARVDADDGDIGAAVATQHTALAATPTGDALARYRTGDALASAADNTKGAAGQFHPDIPPLVGPPPDVPIDTQQPAGEDMAAFRASTPLLDAAVQAPEQSATLPQESSSPVQPGTESPAPSVALVPSEAPPEAILASASPVQGSDASASPSPAAPFVTRDELVEILGQLEATIIVMT